jgi:hypothetical protein
MFQISGFYDDFFFFKKESITFASRLNGGIQQIKKEVLQC